MWSQNASKIDEIHEKSIIQTVQQFIYGRKCLKNGAIISEIDILQLRNRI